jgi:2-polyprenyl-3-methyl-5-hydroxy-6-metoxy-1,4-benzoquinol methylase
MADLEIAQNASGSWSGLDSEVLTILRCIACRSRLDQRAEGLLCADCGKEYPSLNGVVRFVSAENYAGSFGFQWKIHARTQLDNGTSHRSEDAFRRRTGFRPEDLAGKLVLDVGCGMGRFAEVATRWGAHVVGIDLSLACEVAAENLADRNTSIFQADVFQLPFAEHSFDFIYSIGVLHHTPDCEQAVKVLPKFLKPGGRLAVWLYSSYNPWYRMSDVYRKVTRRMPQKLLYKLCHGAVPLYGAHQVLRRIPLIGKPVSKATAWLIPMSFDRNAEWRVLDTFDWYSPWYQSKHSYEEVFRWFESCGLEDLHVGEEPISVHGRRPLA